MDYEEALVSQPRREVIEYIVVEGDTVALLAKKFAVTEQTIYSANSLAKGSKIKPGQSLIILPVDGIIYYVKSGDNLQKIAKNTAADSKEIASFNELENDVLETLH
jgi:LysM repeat protein